MKKAQLESVSRVIPRVATTSLVFWGVACGDDPSSIEEYSTEECLYQQTCNPESFNEGYASLGECISYIQADIESEIEEYAEEKGYSDACVDALLGFYTCYRRALRENDCEYATEETICEDEVAAFYDACDIDDDDSDGGT